MNQLTNDQLYELVRRHGATPGLDRTMVAGALTESGGDADAEGDGGHSYGLWQLHDQGRGAGMSREERCDPDLACTRMLPFYREAWARAAGAATERLRATGAYLDAERPAGWTDLGSPAAARFRGRWDTAPPPAAPAAAVDPVEAVFGEIQWIGALGENFAEGRGQIQPEAVVLHIAEGSLAATDDWFNRHHFPPDGPTSAHFCVGKDGTLHQYVSTKNTAFANGRVEDGHTAVLVDVNAGINPNLWTISIEHEGHSGDIVPAEQLDVSTRLTAWLFRNRLFTSGASGVAVDRDHILRHGEISPNSRPACPGWDDAFLDEYVARVHELLGL